MKGRKPNPALSSLRGNPGRRSPSSPAVADPAGGCPRPPSYLSGAALTEWDRAAPDLHAAGLLTERDSHALALYCQCLARWIEAEARLAAEGTYIENRHGDIVLHPAAREAERLLKQIRPLAQEFGLTPFSRSRLHVQPPSDERNDFEDLLDG